MANTLLMQLLMLEGKEQMNFITLIIFILFCLFGLGIGFFLIKKPTIAIEMQRIFYEKINWKIEPISMQKELRNTRIMGLTLIILLLAASFIYFRNIGFCFKW